MLRRLITATAIIIGLAQALSPSQAAACWDGTRLHYGKVMIDGGGMTWDPKLAASAAIWMPRIDAILPGTDRYYFEWGTAYFDAGVEIHYPEGRLDILFRRLANHQGLSRAERRAAMRAGGHAYTVQLGAFSTEEAASRYANGLWNDAYASETSIGAFGVYEVGGFPAENSTLYVIEGDNAEGETVYRVVSGAFSERGAAAAVRDALSGKGIPAFVRNLR